MATLTETVRRHVTSVAWALECAYADLNEINETKIPVTRYKTKYTEQKYDITAWIFTPFSMRIIFLYSPIAK